MSASLARHNNDVEQGRAPSKVARIRQGKKTRLRASLMDRQPRVRVHGEGPNQQTVTHGSLIGEEHGRKTRTTVRPSQERFYHCQGRLMAYARGQPTSVTGH